MQLEVTKCQCGAITVDCKDFSGEDFSNSMTEETFKKEFTDLELPKTSYYHNCNHCVNHWGIDLCGCGSGEPVGKCEEGFNECLSNTPSQHKGEMKQAFGWV